MHQPVPKASKAILARAQADASHQTHHNFLTSLPGAFASSPDTSTARRGPVDLGSPKPATVQAAAPQPGASGDGNVITVQPVGDQALKGGQPVDTKTAGTTTANTGATNPADTPKTQDPHDSSKPKPDDQPPNR